MFLCTLQAKKSAQWADNDIVESGASASSDDDDVDTVLARLQNAADAGLLEENEVDSGTCTFSLCGDRPAELVYSASAVYERSLLGMSGGGGAFALCSG